MRSFKATLVTCALFALMALAAVGFIATPRATHAASITKITLTFTCAQAVDFTSGKVCVHTDPGAALTIKVKYCSGFYATSKSLQGTKIANSLGNYTWKWIPETSCVGQAVATVVAKWSGQTITKSDVFPVKPKPKP